MKILYFHQHFTTPQGSSGTRSYEMARALVRSGHEVHIVCGSFQMSKTGISAPFVKGKRTGQVDGITITEFRLPYANKDSFAKRTGVFLSFAFKSILVALREPYDLVFATSTPLTAGIPGIAARWLRRKPFVFEVRDLWPELPRAMGVIKNPVILKLMSVLEWVSYRSATACIGLSPGIVEGIRTRSASHLPIAMIPNGCDRALFSESKVPPTSIKGLDNSDLMAVFTGAHGLANGLDAILDAAEVLKARGRDDIKLVFIGDGSQKPRLVARARAAGLTNCLFLDMVPKTELAGLLRQADVGLMVLADVPAFYYGTSPNKFFDYLAMGLPVLNNYPGWLASIIDEQKLGVVVPPGESKAFAEALVELADNRARLADYGANALTLARDRFDRSLLAGEFVGFLEKQLS